MCNEIDRIVNSLIYGDTALRKIDEHYTDNPTQSDGKDIVSTPED